MRLQATDFIDIHHCNPVRAHITTPRAARCHNAAKISPTSPMGVMCGDDKCICQTMHGICRTMHGICQTIQSDLLR